MKAILRIIPFLLVATAVLGGCREKHSPYEGQARERAATAAARLAVTDHADTIALQSSILAAKAVQSEYILRGDSLAARAFDEAFRESLKRNDPGLYQAIFPNDHGTSAP